MDSRNIRVLVADDHPVVRRGLREAFAETEGLEVTGEAATAEELLTQAASGGHDVVVLDLSMPGVRGMELLRELRERHPDLPVVVLSIHPGDTYALHCLRAGASAYVGKESGLPDLVEAVRSAAQGRRTISSDIAQRLLAETVPGRDRPLHETLSKREYQVMLMLASGRTVGEIGEELGLSVKTVSTYRARLLAKMGLRTNAQVTRYVFEHQLLVEV